MPRYYLHLRHGLEELLDEEGAPYVSLETLRSGVLVTVRELISAEALGGKVDFDQRIDAQDLAGNIVHSLRFRDAVILAGL